MFVTKTMYNVGPYLRPLNPYEAMFRNILNLPLKDRMTIINAIDEIDERRKEITQKYDDVIKKHDELTKKHEELELSYKKTMGNCIDKGKFDELNKKYANLQNMCESNESECTLMNHMTKNAGDALKKIKDTLTTIVEPFNVEPDIIQGFIIGLGFFMEKFMKGFNSASERSNAIDGARNAAIEGLKRPEIGPPERPEIGPPPEQPKIEPPDQDQTNQEISDKNTEGEFVRIEPVQGIPAEYTEGNNGVVLEKFNKFLETVKQSPENAGIGGPLEDTINEITVELNVRQLPQGDINDPQINVEPGFWTSVGKINKNYLRLDMSGKYPDNIPVNTTDPQKAASTLAKINEQIFTENGIDVNTTCEDGDSVCTFQQEVINNTTNPQIIQQQLEQKNLNLFMTFMFISAQAIGLTQNNVRPQMQLLSASNHQLPTIGHIGGNIESKKRKSRNNYIGNKYAYFSLSQIN